MIAKEMIERKVCHALSVWPELEGLDETDMEELYYKVMYTGAKTVEAHERIAKRFGCSVYELRLMELGYAMTVARMRGKDTVIS